MALDEPSDGEEVSRVDGLPFVVAEKDSSMVFAHGDVHIDHQKYSFGEGFILKNARSAGGCC